MTFSSLVSGRKESAKGWQRETHTACFPSVLPTPVLGSAIAVLFLGSCCVPTVYNFLQFRGHVRREAERIKEERLFSLAPNPGLETGSKQASLLLVRQVAVGSWLPPKGEGTGLVEDPQGFMSKRV